MSLVKLGARPATFAHTVKIKLLEGGEGLIPVTYKYRTRTEFSEFWDKLTAATSQAMQAASPKEGSDAADPVEAFSLAKIYAKASTKNAQDVLDIITGWGLDEDLTLDAVMQLNDELPLAVATIVGDYYTASTTGRLGN